MPSASVGKLEIEFGQTAYSLSALTDSGDATTFTSSASLWSRVTGFAPDIRPDGVRTGLVFTPTATNNQLSYTAGTCYVNGTAVSVTAGTITLTRGSVNGFKKCSVVVNSSGTVSENEGAEHTAHSDTRGANGGPPYITTTTIELCQVHFTSTTAGVILASEVKDLRNVHREDAYFPGYSIDYGSGQITFTDALMLNHTSDVPKTIYASYADASFSEVLNASDYVPVETSWSQSSTAVYNGTIGAESSSLTQGGCTVYVNDGVSDAILGLANEIVWTRFYPNRSSGSYIKGQGRLGVSRTFPADDNITVTCTFTGDTAFVNVPA